MDGWRAGLVEGMVLGVSAWLGRGTGLPRYIMPTAWAGLVVSCRACAGVRPPWQERGWRLRLRLLPGLSRFPENRLRQGAMGRARRLERVQAEGRPDDWGAVVGCCSSSPLHWHVRWFIALAGLMRCIYAPRYCRPPSELRRTTLGTLSCSEALQSFSNRYLPLLAKVAKHARQLEHTSRTHGTVRVQSGSHSNLCTTAMHLSALRVHCSPDRSIPLHVPWDERAQALRPGSAPGASMPVSR